MLVLSPMPLHAADDPQPTQGDFAIRDFKFASGEALPELRIHYRVVEDGNLLTSAGISAGIDLALRVVARCHGEPVALGTARHMEYRYPQGNTRRVETGGGGVPRRGWRWLRAFVPRTSRKR